MARRININSLTTGQAAELTSVSQASIIRMIDEGILKSWKIPGQNFRRIAAKDLLEFQRSIGSPTEETEKLIRESQKVLRP